MFNKNSFNQELSFNSVNGTLVKSSKDSKFTRFHMDSRRADYVFDTKKPRISEYSTEIEVLQVMLCGNNYLLVEFRDKEGE